jgi:hypothetical protein
MDPSAIDAKEVITKVENDPRFAFIFHHEGLFVPGTEIVTGMNFGIERCFVVTEAAVNQAIIDFNTARAVYETGLPRQELFPNGLSRMQAVQVMSAHDSVIKFNGGAFDEHNLKRSTRIYSEMEETRVQLEDFRGKGALSCAESAAMTQQLLASTLEMTYVSGMADLHGAGNFEGHSFNLVKPADPKYAAAVLDIANPIIQNAPDGTLSGKLYCAPMTATELDRFKKGKPVDLEYAGSKRTYQFGNDPKSSAFVW